MPQIREAMLSAALRHRRDAEQLADGPADASPDQAFHLAGFAAECARKCVLSTETFDKAIGHGVGEAAEAGLLAALALDPMAHRYRLSAWGARYPALAKWTEQARYEKTGSRTPDIVRGVVQEACQIVDAVVFALWADGFVPAGFDW